MEPADAPYAYVVEQRPLDGCAPPNCSIRSSNVVGWWNEIQGDGNRGAYLKFGDVSQEAFFRRAVMLRAGKAYEFSLPAEDAESEYDGYLAAPEGGEWKAEIDVVAVDGAVVSRRPLAGWNEFAAKAVKTADMAHYEEYFTHIRFPLPPRSGRTLTVRIRNVGPNALGVASPLVLRKVIGRKPRQAFFVVFDGVVEPLFTRMLTGSGDPATEWLGRAVRERGTLFARGTSPGFNTPTFVRRFLRAGYYETAGEPGLFGQGFDEEPPPSPPTPVVRLAEQGFQTEATLGNFLLMPTQTRIGFDGGYQNEQQKEEYMHPPALVRRFKQWMAEHPRDDAFNLIWFSITHEPFLAGRPAPPFVLDAPPSLPYERKNLDASWRNLLVSVDRANELVTAAEALSPDADRVWLFATDHGRTFTTRSIKQPTWLPPRKIKTEDPLHCSLASFEEANTPFAVIYDGPPRATPTRVEDPASTTVVWRLLERVFGVHLGLPDTTSFDTPSVSGEAFVRRWDDGLLVSAGEAGSIRGATGKWAYRSLMIRPQTGDMFRQSWAVQLMLTGTPNRGRRFLAEELYDRSADPFELANRADENPDVVLDLRRKLSDWFATYFDPPTHPRYEYTIRFSRPVTLSLEAPHSFLAGADGHALEAAKDRRVTMTGARFTIREGEEPAAVLDVAGAGTTLLRCASTGLPLAELSGARSRVNLAVARTNCRTPGTEAVLGEGDAAFTATLTKERRLDAGGVSSDELMEGLRRWGYVRDLEKSKP